MEVVNQRAALLSNYEVLTWLRELESDHLSRTKTALRIKKEEEISGTNIPGSTPASSGHLEATENLRTVEVEAIGYLSSDYLPTSSQNEDGITSLVKSLADHDLTKAEKLQIVNLAPTRPVELYVIIEELEDRLGDQLDEILGKVQNSLAESGNASSAMANGVITTKSTTTNDPESTPIVIEQNTAWAEDVDAVYDDEYFDDTGAGAGVEGDLDMEED
ncbi:HRDC-like protein [Crepidotus variabilis]|uniref:DNA-directed RNA polymerase III subunit RPC9 n=1 Tax=Crepidotus variabilis TaxID=179855 RepID=A0A9P6JUY4_9AGAR|nr:HRDC-like protein [Crepidotus variabilis]